MKGMRRFSRRRFLRHAAATGGALKLGGLSSVQRVFSCSTPEVSGDGSLLVVPNTLSGDLTVLETRTHGHADGGGTPDGRCDPSYRAEQGVGFQPVPSASLLKSELVVYGRVKYCGSSTLVMTVSQRSPFGSSFRSQYSVTTAFSP